MKSLLGKIAAHKIITTVVIGVVVVGGILVTSSPAPEAATEESATSTASQSVSLLSLSEATTGGVVDTTGTIESQAQAMLAPEVSGTVQSVLVEIGDTVSRGDLLVRLSDTDEQAAVAQAQAGLQAQQARLAELQAGSRPAELSSTVVSVETAESNLAAARENYFNTDLQAYVAETDVYSRSGSLEQPTISGVYESDEAGEYRIELYRSGSQSGYSLRYAGLESGVVPVSTDVPQPLGDRGLFIEFPDDFATSHDLEWVVPIPNTRSDQYSQAKTSLQTAEQALVQAQNNLDLAQEGARSEQVQAQQAAVAQAEASLAAARARLAKKQIRAPFSGEVTDVPASIGEQVSPGQTLVELVDTGSLQVATHVSSHAARSIRVGDTAMIDGDVSGVVTAVAGAVSQQSGKVPVKVRITDPEALLIVGDFVPVAIEVQAENGSDITIPLTAVKNDTQGAYVLSVNTDNRTERVAVETGSIRDGQIVITDGLSDIEQIVEDIRGLTPGTLVQRD